MITTTAFIIILAILVFIASIKASFVISYSDELAVYMRVLFFKINFLPSKKKKESRSMSPEKAAKIKAKLQKKNEKKKAAAAEKKRKKQEEKESGRPKTAGEILDMIKMISSVVKALLGRFFGHLSIRIARIRITVATDDAASTAISYGAITQSLNVLLPLLEDVKNFKKLKKADIDVRADFTKDTPDADIKLIFSIRVWHIFHTLFSALGAFIRHKIANPTPQSAHKAQSTETNK